MSLNLSKIIKRLELIKSLIFLEEEEDIAEQIIRLQDLQPDEEIKGIIFHLEQKSYGKAAKEIETFLNSHHQLSKFTDPEIEGLKLEAKSLEAELNKLSNEKADIEKLIHEFGVRHNKELGELILKILRFRKQKAKGTPEQKEAEKDYNEYSREYEITKNETITELTDEEQKELKRMYRKASKLCHPDVVSEEQKELADKLFAELNAAHERNDLNRVKEILENLERGDFFVNKSEAINETHLLKTEIEKLRLRIKELKKEIIIIKESEAFTTISSINDWEDYFKENKRKLAAQLKELEDGK